jgi:hypothetical protein
MKKFLLLALVCLMTALGPMAAEAAILYGAEGGSDLYRIDTVAMTATFVGSDTRSGPETQIDPTGTIIYMNQVCDPPLFPMHLINPATGLNTGSLSLSGFPAPTDTVTAMEFVGNTLYGSLHECGPESSDGILATINTTTGAITTIGPMTGMDKPTGGMSYVGSTMYAVSSTDNNDSRLFTVNLTTGAATLVANITLSGVQQESATALAYANSTMYTVLNGDSNLYSINLSTGALTVEFDMGVNLNSLTAVITAPPAPQRFTQGEILFLALFVCFNH